MGADETFDAGTPVDLVDLVDLAAHALSLATPDAQLFWRDQLVGLNLESCDDVVDAASNLSDPIRTFIKQP